jgi:hypothetical protein
MSFRSVGGHDAYSTPFGDPQVVGGYLVRHGRYDESSARRAPHLARPPGEMAGVRETVMAAAT